MPIWPVDLPFFPDASVMKRSSPINAMIRTDMSSGPAKTRPRFSAAPKARMGRIHRLTKAQMEQFETFFADTISFGADSFTATDPFDCTEREFRIMGYEIGRSGANFTVEAEIEVLP